MTIVSFGLGMITGLLLAALWDIYFQSEIERRKRKSNDND